MGSFQRDFRTVWSSFSSFNFTYSLFSWKSSSKLLGLLPPLPVTFILPSIFPSITCCRWQFLCRWNQSSYPSFILLFVECRLLLVFMQHFFSHTVGPVDIFSTTFHDFQGNSDPLLEASKWRDLELIKLTFHYLFLEWRWLSSFLVFSCFCTRNCWWCMYRYLRCCFEIT